MTRIAIVTGSTRPGRKAPEIAQWVHRHASQRVEATFEIVDIADYDLPLIDEPLPPMMGQRHNQHTQLWSECVDTFDGFIFVTPEYNHAASPALINAIDYLHAEWKNKVAGLVSYGFYSGVRAAQQLRLLLAPLAVATVAEQVTISLVTDYTNHTEFTPGEHHLSSIDGMLDQLIDWTTALAPLRSKA